MGVNPNISYEKYPKQGNTLGRRISVCYEYATDFRHRGTCIRDDVEGDYRTIFQLDNGRIIMAEECQWTYLSDREIGEEQARDFKTQQREISSTLDWARLNRHNP